MSNFKKVLVLINLISFSSCSTLKKTMVYSALSSAVAGAVIGRSMSPNEESNNFNTTLGALSGAIIGAGVGYLFYKDANPDLTPYEMKSSLVNDYSIKANQEDSLPFHPQLIPLGPREYIDLNGASEEVKDQMGRRYKQAWRSEKQVISKDNSIYEMPSFQLIEYGSEK